MDRSVLQIRTAELGDMAMLAPFAARNFAATHTHYDPADLQAHLAKACSEAYFIAALQNQVSILLAYEGDQLIGYGMIGPVTVPVDTTGQNACEIYRLYIDAQHHGRGVGQALMQAMLETPLAMAASHIYLSVWEHNQPAQRFYAACGFTPVGAFDYQIGNHVDLDLILCKPQ